MTAPESHKEFSKLRDYPLGVRSIEVFTRVEIEKLHRYGFWLEALAVGRISAMTEEQKQFIKVSKGEADPETFYEKAWDKLIERRKFERTQYNYDPDYINRIVHENTFSSSGDWWSAER